MAATADTRRRHPRHLRDQRRPGEEDDLPGALPPRAPRRTRLPDHRRRERRLDRRGRCASTPRSRYARRSEHVDEEALEALPGAARPTSRATTRRPRPTSSWQGASGSAEQAVFYLEIPPSLFAEVVRRLGAAGLTEGARVVIEKPFGHDLESARELNAELHEVPRRGADPAHRPLPRQGAGDGHPLPALRQRDARADLEPPLRRLASRSRWPRTSGSRTAAASTTPSARCATSSRTTCCRCWRWSRWSRPSGGGRPRPGPRPQGRPLPRRCRPPTRRATCAASTTATAMSTASPRTPTTETFVALKLRGRQLALGRGAVLHPRRQGAAGGRDRGPGGLPASRRGWGSAARRPEPDELILRIKPDPGAELCLMAKKGGEDALQRVHLDLLFERAGRRPARALRAAAARRAARRHPALPEPGRDRADVADRPAAARRPAARSSPTSRGAGARRAASHLVHGHGGWRKPWLP